MPLRAAPVCLVLALFLAGSASTARAELCSAIEPFINEIDYDDDAGFPNNDRDEFVEIAAAAGTDLSGYRLLAVEGNPGIVFLGGIPCSTGFGADEGESHFDVTLPPGSIVPDFGDGIGYFVVCLTTTSQAVINSGDCDVVLNAGFSDSSLKNGHLTNGNAWECPDGALLLDDQGGFVDALSWEGVVPNQGPYGGHFQNPPYSIGVDDGFGRGESIYKNNDATIRALGPSEWTLSGVNEATPSRPNPGQALACDSSVDTDSDGIIDALDNCPAEPNAGQEDADSDGVGDVCDNCAATPNPAQEDTDSDGIGNACEPAVPVPALPAWGIALLALLLLGAAATTSRRACQG